MFTLFRRELKSLILKPFTMIVFALSFLAPAIIFSVFLSMGPTPNETQSTDIVYAGFESLVSIVALFFAAAIPVVTIYVNARERKEKNYNFLITLPLSRMSIMMSKFLALVVYFVLPLSVMAIYPTVFSSYGEVNYLQCYLALIMLVLFVIFLVAFSFMISVRKTGIIVAGIISYLTIALSYVLGILAPLVRFLPFGTGFDAVVGGIFTELSIFKKLDKSVIELFAWSDVIFFAVGIVVFVVIASFSYGKDFLQTEKKKEKIKVDKKRVAIVCSSLILVVCVGILPVIMPYSVKAIDVSKNDLYSPNSAYDSFFENIDEDITIYLLNPYLDNNELYNVIRRTAERSDRITLEIVNPMEDADIMEKYGMSTIDDVATLDAMAYAMIVQGKSSYVIIEQSDFYLFSNGSDHFTQTEYYNQVYYYQQLYSYYYNVYAQYSQLNNLTEEQQLKLAQLEQSIQQIMQILERLATEFVVSMNAEPVIVSAIEYVIDSPAAYALIGHGEELIMSNSFDLSKSAQIPEDATVLVINSPSEDYSASEIEILKKYVADGGKLYILADVENYSMPNFSALLNYYGLSVESESISSGDGNAVEVTVNKTPDFFKNLSVDTIDVIDARKITVPETSGKYTYKPLLSYVKTEGEGEDAVKTSYPVAYSVNEGSEEKVLLFTGAKTVNDEDNGLSETDFKMGMLVFLYPSAWFLTYENFEASNPVEVPKVFQKSPYETTTGDVIKNVIIFAVVIPAGVLFSAAVYSLSRRLRSNRGKNGNPEIY